MNSDTIWCIIHALGPYIDTQIILQKLFPLLQEKRRTHRFYLYNRQWIYQWQIKWRMKYTNHKYKIVSKQIVWLRKTLARCCKWLIRFGYLEYADIQNMFMHTNQARRTCHLAAWFKNVSKCLTSISLMTIKDCFVKLGHFCFYDRW